MFLSFTVDRVIRPKNVWKLNIKSMSILNTHFNDERPYILASSIFFERFLKRFSKQGNLNFVTIS